MVFPHILFSTRPRLLLPTAVGTALFLQACSSVDPRPFERFNRSVAEAAKGADAALATGQSWTRTGHIEAMASDPKAKFSDLVILPGEGYDWRWERKPVCLEMGKARLALADLNQSFLSYSELLSQLASDKAIDQERLDAAAAELNNGAKEALDSVGLSSPDGAAMFSTAAIELARVALETRRAADLAKAIKSNQPCVKAYARLCAELVKTIRGASKSYYADACEPFRLSWEKGAPAARRQTAAAMLDLNDKFINAMRILAELERLYDTLPKAHADLAKAITEPSLDTAELRRLYNSGLRIQRLYNQLKKGEE